MFGRTPETHPAAVTPLSPTEAAAIDEQAGAADARAEAQTPSTASVAAAAIDALPIQTIAVARAAAPPPSVARPGQLPEPPKTVAVLTSGQILEREKEKGKIAAEIDKLKTRLEQL